ncbi:hypothetical protein GF324_10175 [bacterium]|nr:hypothetical protein [bacterium]
MEQAGQPMNKTITSAYNWREPSLTWPVTTETGPGMEGVIACETRVAWVDPAGGGIYYRGVPAVDLARTQTYEQVAFLLIEGKQADEHPDEFAGFRDRLREARRIPAPVVDVVRNLPRDTHPTRLLRAGVSALGCFMMSSDEDRYGTRHWQDLEIVGQLTRLVGEVARHRRGLPAGDPACDCSLAAGLLEAINDREPTPEETARLDMAWVFYADHGLDAPAFTGMVVGSALADPYYNIVAGLSALRGAKQGGTGEYVLHELLKLRDPHVARAWARGMLAQGWRIPGFGHRLYRQPDPRVEEIKQQVRALADQKGQKMLVDVAEAVEDEVTSRLAQKGVHANINLYSAVLFHLLGSEPEMVPCLYAVGRVAGMVARVREYLAHNRLFRPLEIYAGPEERSYVPMEAR